MPTNLKSLLSRSRSRNDLKGRGEKEEEVGPCVCSPNGDGATPPPGIQAYPPTCQCQLESDSWRKGSTSSGNMEQGSLRRDISSRSLFSLPAENLMTSVPTSPVAGGRGSSASSSPQHLATTSQTRTIRKCETVQAFPGLTTTESPGGSSGNPPAVTSSRVKVMKDRILSTSSSALSTLFQTSNKTTTKLFSGWKLSSKPSSQGTQTMTPISGGLESSKSQILYGAHQGVPPLTPTNRLRRHGSITNPQSYSNRPNSRRSSVSSIIWSEEIEFISCRLCLCDVNKKDTVEIQTCSCLYCKDCATAYVSFEVQEGAYDIACPDATCERQGILTIPEIESLVTPTIFEKHKKFRLFKDVEADCELMWCPSPGCDTVCKIEKSDVNGVKPGTIPVIQCLRCQHVYCTECKLPIHSNSSCDSYRQKLIRQGKLSSLDDEPFASCDSIKKCPFCSIPIEKDSGCAQMMCKRCKHVFCWYCLSPLDDDFLLRHYDKGPCKNKLGHSRASVVWHRTQVIGIFVGFGLLILLASPLLILASPCFLCCRCRYCTSHLESDESPVSI